MLKSLLAAQSTDAPCSVFEVSREDAKRLLSVKEERKAQMALSIIPLTLFSSGVAAPLQNIVLRAQAHMGRPALGGFVIKDGTDHRRQDQVRR